MSSPKAILAIVVSLLTQAAAAEEPACPAPEKPMLRVEMYFGRGGNRHKAATRKQWADFVRNELTPRFPDGLTVLDAEGRWRDPAGRIVGEASKLVIIVVANKGDVYGRIEAAAAAYKQRFRQISVGIVTRPVCAEF